MSEETSFCSRCGYLLSGTAELLKMGGALSFDADVNSKRSARSRGVKHGIFLVILGILIFPVFGLLFTFGLGMRNPWPAGLVLFLLFAAGILRIVYSLMFERTSAGSPSQASIDDAYLAVGSARASGAATAQLKPSSIEPISVQTHGWLDEDNLEPSSITEETTNLLEKPMK
jgi:hypothetical protein